MQKLANQADLYVSPVLPFGAGDKVNHPDFSQSCFDHPGFAKIEGSLASTLEQFGFSHAFNFDGSGCNSCSAIGSNHLVIDPDGKLFRCWDSVGDPSEAIGHISAPPAEEPHMKNPKLLQWLSYDPFEQKECRDCKFLPLCMGGCPHRSIADGVDFSMRCAMIKFNYKQVLAHLPEG
jgi:uncharacterized protein